MRFITFVLLCMAATDASAWSIGQLAHRWSEDQQTFYATITVPNASVRYTLGNTFDGATQINRIFVDFHGASLVTARKIRRQIPIGQGHVVSVRIGAYEMNTVRLVVDVRSPGRFYVEKSDDKHLTLVIPSAMSQLASAAAITPAQVAPKVIEPKPLPKAPAVSVPVTAPQSGNSLPQAFAAKPIPLASKPLEAVTSPAPPKADGQKTPDVKAPAMIAAAPKAAAGPRAVGYGQLVVRTIPLEVEVYVNGQYRGLTPFVDPKVPAGTYTLGLRKDNFERVEKEVEILPDQTGLLIEILPLAAGN